MFLDIAQFIRYYGNDTFRDGNISYFLFVYLSRQIPALEARDIFVTMEGSAFAQGGTNNSQSKKRFNELQNLISSGVHI